MRCVILAEFRSAITVFQMRFISCVAVAVLCSCAVQSSAERSAADAKKQTSAIRKVLDAQVAAWNRGDIPGFMDGYVRGEKLRFASGGTYRFGWKVTLEKYQKSYPNADAMGRLTFSDLKIQLLSPQYAEVFGRWHLKRGGEFEDISGLYTLLMQRTESGWRVLHDHTSSKPPETDKKAE